MKPLLLLFPLALLLSHASAKEPINKHPVQNPVAPPVPRVVLISFTFKLTDFSISRVSRPAFGIRDSRYNATINAANMSIGDKRLFRRVSLGNYHDPSEPVRSCLVSWGPDASQMGFQLGEASASTLKDIYGADAITDVVEKPYEQVLHEDQAKEQIAILDMLKKSAGDIAQAAYRLHMTEPDLQKKIIQYSIATPKK